MVPPSSRLLDLPRHKPFFDVPLPNWLWLSASPWWKSHMAPFLIYNRGTLVNVYIYMYIYISFMAKMLYRNGKVHLKKKNLGVFFAHSIVTMICSHIQQHNFHFSRGNIQDFPMGWFLWWFPSASRGFRSWSVPHPGAGVPTATRQWSWLCTWGGQNTKTFRYIR